ncbi:MAG: hypothetical protein M0026_14565 [Nocardiopsaceae bacterium]|nr:hypothetical protein [Nocardiopsaceae bacterium]
MAAPLVPILIGGAKVVGGFLLRNVAKKGLRWAGKKGAQWLAKRGGWKGLLKGIGKGAGKFLLGAGAMALKLGGKLALSTAISGIGAIGAAAASSNPFGLLSALATTFEGSASGQGYGMDVSLKKAKKGQFALAA